MICWPYRASERAFAARVTSTFACAALRAAIAWLYWFRTSRGSICARSAPFFTKEPTWTGIFTIWPEALDFTSTRSIGSTAPVASMVSEMFLDSTGAVMIVVLSWPPRMPRITKKAAIWSTTTAAIAIGRREIDPTWSQVLRSTRAGVAISELPSHQRLELRLRDALVVARADQVAPGLVELRLRGQHVEQGGGPDRVALLLDAEILLGRLDRGRLGDHPLLGRMERAELLGQGLDRRE